MKYMEVDRSSEKACSESLTPYAALISRASVLRDTAISAREEFEKIMWKWDSMTPEEKENIEDTYVALNNIALAFSKYTPEGIIEANAFEKSTAFKK